jgi:hypothetical protein
MSVKAGQNRSTVSPQGLIILSSQTKEKNKSKEETDQQPTAAILN